MVLEFLIKGVIIGFTASVPLGPIGVLCIQKTISKGRISGFVSGLGAAASDMFYAIIAGFGLSFVTNFILENQLYLKIAAAIILFYLGFKIFFTKTVNEIQQSKKKGTGLFGDFISIFFLTVSNPLALFFFGGAFAAFGFAPEGSGLTSIMLLTVGVFIGAALWWTILTTIVNLFRSKFKIKRLWWVNKIAGVIVILFGVLAIISIFYLSENIVNETIR